ncbi:MAG: Oxygen regulatory protein NreC [Anaerolineae bacterium]|nr:Oxygen regulatory protein NreC [Anaerolineae bacterium]
MSKITVLLAEDHTIVRQGLRSLLDNEPEIEVVGEAGDGQEAIQKTEQLRPAVVVMDITMPILNGLEATRQIKKLFPAVKVVILTVHSTEEHIYQILRAGASGYVVKQGAVPELIEAIRAAAQGNTFLSPTISRQAIDEYGRQAEVTVDRYDRLTDREREVLQLIAEGRTSREMASRMHVTVKTVEAHRAHLMDKLGLHTIADLTRYALRKGMIGPD